MPTPLVTPIVPVMTTEIRLRGSAMTMTLLMGSDRKMASVMLFAFGGTLISRQLTGFYEALS